MKTTHLPERNLDCYSYSPDVAFYLLRAIEQPLVLNPAKDLKGLHSKMKILPKIYQMTLSSLIHLIGVLNILCVKW